MILPIAFAVTLVTVAPPAEAGRACRRAGLPSPCVVSSDVNPNITLRRPGNDGDFQVRTSGNRKGVQLDGDSGNVTNRLPGNGVTGAISGAAG